MGIRGERIATKFLIDRNYTILSKNLRIGRDEIDVIVRDPLTHEVVFVEVKTRSGNYAGDPGEAVNWRKLRAVARLARTWIREVWRRGSEFRIDVIAISPGKLKHYKNVSW